MYRSDNDELQACAPVFNGILAVLMDTYRNYLQLALAEEEGRDYVIEVRHGTSGHAVIAPHGGRIERGTGPVADAIAGQQHTYYCFAGIKPGVKLNKGLHVTSNHFDEPRALAAVSRCERVISVHGARGDIPVVYAGGLDMELRAAVMQGLTGAGILAIDDPSPTRQGRGATNICNRGVRGAGLQLELSFALRKQLFNRHGMSEYRPNPLFCTLVAAVRQALSEFQQPYYSTVSKAYASVRR